MKSDTIAPISAVHRLLFQALLEIRKQGHGSRNKVVFHLADLFHNVVLEMETAARGGASYEDVLQSLTRAAAERGLDRWLTKTTADLITLQAQTEHNGSPDRGTTTALAGNA